MSTVLILAFDVVAITVLAYGIYFTRHRRRDMLIAYMALNTGVLAVTTVLASAPVAAGLGLGLFGVLSIIRLRSSQLTQEEVGYYFAALALGLISGLRPEPLWVAPMAGTLILVVMFVADHPGLFPRNRQQTITLDQAITDEVQLTARLEQLLGARIQRVIVAETDLVRDITVVDVRYRVENRRARVQPEPVGATDTHVDPTGLVGGRTQPSHPEQSNAVQSHAVQPHAVQPHAVQPHAVQPHAVQPHAMQRSAR